MPWLVCLSAGLFFLYEFFQLNVFDVINQPLRDAFGMDAAQLSWMSSAYVWANVLFLLPAGVLLDRFSTRRVILMAMGICVLGTLGFALAHAFAWAAFFHALTGLGNAFCFLSCVVLVSRWFPARRQALVIGCLVTMAFIGGMIAHTPFAYLSAHYGWREAMLIDTGVGAVIFAWIFFIVKDNPKAGFSPNKTAVARPYFAGFLHVLTNPQNWFAGIYTSCLNLPIMVLCALWGASYLAVSHQLTGIAASNIVSLIFMGSIVGCPLVGWISDRLGRRKPLMIIGAIATLITIAPLLVGIALSPTALSVLFFALGVFTSTQVIAYPLIAESNAPERTGVATGMASVIIMGGGGLGQVLFGILMRHHAGEASHQYAVGDFQFALWMFPIAALVALMAILLTQETHCERLKRSGDASD
ncbi:MAG TPA: MFS transporter [Legionella sp.]|nr:MFS transporter [Legionella sp.]